MPEIKHQFTGGKMNKDLDERLIPKGEYRDAMNIQVSTSEGSDVGAVQNILGNSEIASQAGISSSAVCVGAIADEKNDKLYWFVRDPGAVTPFDGIFEYTSNTGITSVLIDTNLDVLKFNVNNIITGINIIDHMLFFTDNQNEPKKINIPLSIEGTTGISHTNFINHETQLSVPIKEEHITVIKKGPTTPLTTHLISERTNDQNKIYSGIMRITPKPTQDYDGPSPLDGVSFMQQIPLAWNSGNTSSMWFPRSVHNYHYDFSQLSVGDRFDTYIETDINGNSGFELDWQVGDTLLFQAFGGELYDQVPDVPLTDYTVKARIKWRYQYVPNSVHLQNAEPLSTSASTLNDPPKVFSQRWTQGVHDNRLMFYSILGGKTRITEMHLYRLDAQGFPTGPDLFPNPYFHDTDPSGNPLPKFGQADGCCAHGPGTNAGIQYSENPNYTDPDQPNVFYPNVIIDHTKFPCFPCTWHMSLYPGDNHYNAPMDPRHDTDGQWRTVYDNSGGYIQAGGCGYDAVQLDNDPNNFGGLITAGYGPVHGTNTTIINFQRHRGGENGVHWKHGYYNWRYYANDLTITGSDAYDYTSYEIINQAGYLQMSMNNVPDFYEGGDYELTYTVADSGHGFIINRGDGTVGSNSGIGYHGGNGQFFLVSQGIVNPWQQVNYFTDQPQEIIRNGEFLIPDGNGNLPKHWNVIGISDSVTYNPNQHYVEIGRQFDASGNRYTFHQGDKLNQLIAIGIEDDQTYNIKFELSDIDTDSEGLRVAIIGSPYTDKKWTTPVVNTEGVHEFVISTETGTGATDPGLLSGNRVYFTGANPIGLGGEGFIGRIHNVSVQRVGAPNANVSCEVLALHNPPTVPQGMDEIPFVVDLEKSKNKLYEFKFPRFGYRYKYRDHEYSQMAPFSQVAFIPGNFRYDPQDGFNRAMTNRLIEVTLKDYMIGMPDGVVAIDILFKDDTSPNVYIIDTIKPRHTALSDTNETIWNLGEYTVTTEQIHRAIESNQLLRPWDNVPLKALAQDVTGNRIVYGNYVQGFDLQSFDDATSDYENYYPDFNFDAISADNLDFVTEKSIKSLREYQLGIAFADEYGRETPVISNYSGTLALEKEDGRRINQLQVGFNNNKFPENLKYFKFFVKETSNEYYNLAMDRWYDAEDGGAWLAFPSNDRNKVDIDTYLILKKSLNTNEAVIDETRYKILDIQDSVPAFVRQNRQLVSSRLHNFTDSNDPGIFGSSMVDSPEEGESTFKMNYKPYFNSSGSDLHKINNANLYVDFISPSGNVTERYRISNITCDYDDGDEGTLLEDASYSIVLDGSFGEDIKLITNDQVTGFNATEILDGTIVNIYQYTDENLSRFDGRFFAKINIDADFNEQLLTTEGEAQYRVVESKKLYYLSSDISLHDGALTGHGALSDMPSSYNGDFGKFASFFRNYDKPANYISVPLIDSGGANRNVGAFVFGDDSDTNRPWLKELAWITTNPDHNSSCPIGIKRTDDLQAGSAVGTAGPGDFWPGKIKIADTSGYTNKQKIQGEFNTNGEQLSGDVWFIDGGNYFTQVSEARKLQWIQDDPSGGLNNTRLINSNPGSGTHIDDSLVINDNYITFEIGVGTVYNEQEQYATPTSGSSGPIDNFWNIGKEDGSSVYEGLKEVIGQLQPGRKFRFRQDPTQEIYTIQEDVEEINRIRWGTISAKVPYCPGGGSGCSVYTGNQYDYGWHWFSPKDVSNQANPFTQEYLSWRVNRYPTKPQYECPNPADCPDGTWFIDSENGTCTSFSYSTHGRFATQLSPNFTKTWKPKVLNSQGLPEVNWNPVGPPGLITNGLELEIFHSTEPGIVNTNTPPTVYVHIDSLKGTHTDGTKHDITVGMVLISHSDAATNAVFDGSTPGLEYLAIRKIEIIDLGGGSGDEIFRLHLTGYSKMLSHANVTVGSQSITAHKIFTTTPNPNQKMIFAQPTMNGYSQYSVNRINAQNAVSMGWTKSTPGIIAIGYNLDFIEVVDLDANLQSAISENPAIWETEPKEAVDLDLYYEASGLNPLHLDTYYSGLQVAPIGSKVETIEYAGNAIEDGTTISGVAVDQNGDLDISVHCPTDDTNYIDPDTGVVVQGVLVGHNIIGSYILTGYRLKITKPNGEIIILKIIDWYMPDANNRTSTLKVSGDLYGPDTTYILNWHNCYSFGNGVESNRVRDNFNLPFISNGPRVSTVWEGDYNQEHRKYGLIYSGLYNASSSVNNLNQFIAAEKITKDINPIYGSIQKLHSRDSDLVVLCEDKILKILANKDAVFNADGNANLTATNNVLGQTIPFVGEYGISKNPESFASESYRAYFTDKIRGAVMRLSRDGLTPISEAGMKDWFRDNLRLSNKLIGSYDDKKDEYNITLKDINKTVSYKENVRGWVSFKSFVPEFAISMANNYYTMKTGRLFEHHKEIGVNRNTFYGTFTNSSINVIFNEAPDSIKSFRTLNYEGSQSKIDQTINNTSLTFDYQNNGLPTQYNDQEYYNLVAADGWYAESIVTDQDEGHTTNFVEKEGKWFVNMNKFIDINL